ncbi:MAG TPA: zinc ribbon domain-containing protein [Phycisphaerae bacterium]|jgi:hypothetical protein|nr:zinc ribbon domain-containing protein [Phycisphaerae bacterium]
MTMIEFTSNYTDHSSDQGFQFEFHCDKCGSGYMTRFVPSKMGVATGFFRAAASLFGNSTLDRVASAGTYAKDSMRGQARDDAFAAAVAEGKNHFHKCTHCGKWVCPDTCWNADRGMCENCAPDLQEEAAAAQAEAAKQQVWQKAALVDQTEGMDLGVKQLAVCPACGAKAGPGKFCGECGKELRPRDACAKCGGKLAPGAKFCGQCGAKQA